MIENFSEAQHTLRHTTRISVKRKVVVKMILSYLVFTQSCWSCCKTQNYCCGVLSKMHFVLNHISLLLGLPVSLFCIMHISYLAESDPSVWVFGCCTQLVFVMCDHAFSVCIL